MFRLVPDRCLGCCRNAATGCRGGLVGGSLEDMDNLPAPEVIAREIVEDLTAALAEFEAVAAALEAASTDEAAGAG